MSNLIEQDSAIYMSDLVQLNLVGITIPVKFMLIGCVGADTLYTSSSIAPTSAGHLPSPIYMWLKSQGGLRILTAQIYCRYNG